MAAITLAVTMLYMFMLRCTAKPVLYVSFILILVLLIVGGIYVWFLATDKYLPEDNTYTAMRGCAILLWILAALYFVVLMCCCSRIELGVDMMVADIMESHGRIPEQQHVKNRKYKAERSQRRSTHTVIAEYGLASG